MPPKLMNGTGYITFEGSDNNKYTFEIRDAADPQFERSIESTSCLNADGITFSSIPTSETIRFSFSATKISVMFGKEVHSVLNENEPDKEFIEMAGLN